MKHLLGFILLMAVLVAVITGCGGAHRYDGRLTAADSLMHDNPDSTLAIIQAVCPDSLTTQGDRAYRDLLLTQARYKCYIVATSDSDINRALAYYRQHKGDREKLTRAYIYKGAVMEELGYPDSAMFYYKHAEYTCDEKDYFNLGYCKMRVGSLLRDYHTIDGEDIICFEEALESFMKTENLTYQHKCMNNLGCLLRESNPKKAEQMLKRAIEISRETNNEDYVEDLHALTVLYYHNQRYEDALQLVRQTEMINSVKPDFSFCTTIAMVYAKNGLIDSAIMYQNLASQYDYQSNDKSLMYFIESKAEIALAKGDSLSYLDLKRQETQISNALIANAAKPQIIKIADDFDKQYNKHIIKRHSRAKLFVIILFAVVFIVIVSASYHFYFSSRKYHHIIESLKNDSDSQLASLNKLQKNIDRLKINDEQIKSFTNSQIELLREITVACYQSPKNKLAVKLKQILAFQDENKGKWTLLYNYIDADFNGIMTHTQTTYPELNDKELLLLALTCMGFSYIQSAIILGYSNATSVGTMKLRVAEKMGLDCSLNDYIKTMTR